LGCNTECCYLVLTRALWASPTCMRLMVLFVHTQNSWCYTVQNNATFCCYWDKYTVKIIVSSIFLFVYFLVFLLVVIVDFIVLSMTELICAFSRNHIGIYMRDIGHFEWTWFLNDLRFVLFRISILNIRQKSY